MSHLSRVVLLALALGEASAAPAAGRSLHWRLLEAEARLDTAGDLHVVERQAMVFTGDWNGGERTFRVEEYTLSGVLVRGADGTYRLRHDFAFPDRPGKIREVRATLSLDAAWAASGGPLALTRRDLPPGAGAVMTVDRRAVAPGARPGPRARAGRGGPG